MSPCVQLSVMFFYTLFFGTLLELPRYQPRLWQWYRYFLVCLTSLFALVLGGYAVWEPISILRAYYSQPIAIINAGCIISELTLAGLALRGKHPLRKYAFAGLAFLMAGGLMMLLIYRLDIPRVHPFTRMPSLFLGAATLFEVFCFSLALGRRAYLIELENSRIQQRYTHDLEAQLAQRLRRSNNKAACWKPSTSASSKPSSSRNWPIPK